MEGFTSITTRMEDANFDRVRQFWIENLQQSRMFGAVRAPAPYRAPGAPVTAVHLGPLRIVRPEVRAIIERVADKHEKGLRYLADK